MGWMKSARDPVLRSTMVQAGIFRRRSFRSNADRGLHAPDRFANAVVVQPGKTHAYAAPPVVLSGEASAWQKRQSECLGVALHPFETGPPLQYQPQPKPP